MSSSADRVPPTVLAAVLLVAARSALNAWVAVSGFGLPAAAFALIGISISLALCLLVLLGDWRARLLLGAITGFAVITLVRALIADGYRPGQTSGVLASVHPLIDIVWALVALALLFAPRSHPWFARRRLQSAPTP